MCIKAQDILTTLFSFLASITAKLWRSLFPQRKKCIAAAHSSITTLFLSLVDHNSSFLLPWQKSSLSLTHTRIHTYTHPFLLILSPPPLRKKDPLLALWLAETQSSRRRCLLLPLYYWKQLSLSLSPAWVSVWSSLSSTLSPPTHPLSVPT